FTALAGGIGWVIRDWEAREAEILRLAQAREQATEQAVANDLRDADFWRAKEQWASALQALLRAQARLDVNGPESLQDEVAARRREVDLVIRLEEARLMAAEVSSDGKYDYDGADRAYAEAFAKSGFNMAFA